MTISTINKLNKLFRDIEIWKINNKNQKKIMNKMKEKFQCIKMYINISYVFYKSIRKEIYLNNCRYAGNITICSIKFI